MKKTIYEKIWEQHYIPTNEGETPLLYIDRHLIHEVTSPQAFEGLRINNRKLKRPDKTIATMDHSIPTKNRLKPFEDKIAQQQVDTLAKNCKEYGVLLYDLNSEKQGIIHVMAPEQGVIHPGMTVVCGDSHTATHGAFGALAFGIGTSEVEHVFSTQTIRQKKEKTMLIEIEGNVSSKITAKDIILAVIGKIGSNGGTGYILEYAGKAIEDLSMEGRMTLCNMSIEAGSRAGLIAPDQKTFEFLKGKQFSPKGEDWNKAVAYWLSLQTDEGANYDKIVKLDAQTFEPQVTWGTSPDQVIGINEIVPSPENFTRKEDKQSCINALKYMGLEAGQKLSDTSIDFVFIGSCTNSRIEDLRAAAAVVKGKSIAPSVQGIVVPGSGLVKIQAEKEGLDQVFIDAGFEWREPGCSMCIAMNSDVLAPEKRCASTSNRNFEGRQGRGGRTHLVSPEMAAAAGIAGKFVDIRDFK